MGSRSAPQHTLAAPAASRANRYLLTGGVLAS
jgi:hypothetical protein